MDAFDWLLEARYQFGRYPSKHRLELVHFDEGHIVTSNGPLMRVFHGGHTLPRLSMTLEQFNLWRTLGVVAPEAIDQVPDWRVVLRAAREGRHWAELTEHAGGFYEVKLKENKAK